LSRQFQQHAITILVSLFFLAGIIYVDYLTGPEISMGPFYLAPCAVLALVVGRGWGTIGVLLCTLAITGFRDVLSPHFHSMSKLAMLWNMSMRFVFFEIFVLLLDRIRRDFARMSTAAQRNSSLD